MVSKSATSIFDFLRLAQSWLKIVAASGLNFLGSVAVGAESCFSSQSSAQFPPDRRALFQVAKFI
jgi:hypothetical protein